MGNNPPCISKLDKDEKTDETKVEVKIHDVICCDKIQSSCCIKTEKKHHKHHKHKHNEKS